MKWGHHNQNVTCRLDGNSDNNQASALLRTEDSMDPFRDNLDILNRVAFLPDLLRSNARRIFFHNGNVLDRSPHRNGSNDGGRSLAELVA